MELQTVVEELPSGAVGEMVPVVLATIGVGMVPNADPGASAFGDIVIKAVSLGMGVIGTVDVDGAGDMDGAGAAVVVDAGELGSLSSGAARANVGGTGIVEPGNVDRKDVPGWADR
jgi:hypothetical protein